MKNRIGIAVALVAVLAVLASAAYAFTDGGEIHACVKDNGQVRIVNAASDCKDKEAHLVWNVAGPQGERGPQGETGPRGEVGLPGPQGDIGPRGLQGEIGPQGEQGGIGPLGEPGREGPAGAAGVSCWDLNGNGLAEPEEDANLDGNVDSRDCQGPQGEPGPKGETGPEGKQGEPGPVGPGGAAGPAGPPGGGLDSLEALEGIPCNDGVGTLSVSIAGDGDVALTCAGGCGVGLTACAPGVCADLMTDEANCGTCGHVCDAGAACLGGTCQAQQADCPIPEWAEPEAVTVANMLSEARAEAGLGCLQLNEALTQAAYAHAQYNAHNEGATHEEEPDKPYFTGRDFGERSRAAGYTGAALGEFVAWAPEDGARVAQMWIDSPQHYEYLLYPGFRGIGVGYYQGNWVAVFGSR